MANRMDIQSTKETTMTSIIKGFVEIPTLINNSPGMVATIGEMSEIAKTFSTNKQVYDDPVNDAGYLTVFNSLTNGVDSLPTAAAVSLIIGIVQTSWDTFLTSKPFGEQLQAAYPELTDVSQGVDFNVTGHLLPSWFQATFEDDGSPTTIRIWLSDELFKAEYSEREIKVLGPCLDPNSLYGAYAIAKAATDLFTTPVRFNELNKLIAGDPPTNQLPVTLNWIDPTDPNNTIVLEFITVGHGPSSAVYENQLAAIRDYLLDSGDHVINEWVQYIPELVNIDRFLIFPQWDRVSLSSSLYGDTRYSPLFLADKSVDNIKKCLTNVNLSVIRPVTDMSSIVWKSLGLAILGDAQNTTGKVRFSDVYSDFAPIPLNEPDINTISALTRSVLLKLEALASLAEKDDGVIELPTNFSRVTNNGVNYIENKENGIVMQMATKETYLAVI